MIEADRRVEVFRCGRWQDVAGLHAVRKGERFRLHPGEDDPELPSVYEGRAIADGFFNTEGRGTVKVKRATDETH